MWLINYIVFFVFRPPNLDWITRLKKMHKNLLVFHLIHGYSFNKLSKSNTYLFEFFFYLSWNKNPLEEKTFLTTCNSEALQCSLIEKGKKSFLLWEFVWWWIEILTNACEVPYPVLLSTTHLLGWEHHRDPINCVANSPIWSYISQ